MSALTLRKVSVFGADSDSCTLENCNRKGRYSVEIAGYPLPADSPLAMNHQARLCQYCAAAWKRMWGEFSGDDATLEKAA